MNLIIRMMKTRTLMPTELEMKTTTVVFHGLVDPGLSGCKYIISVKV